MKKVLILAYDFPPYVSVGGLRPHAWYQYFKEYDIEPIVVTRQWNNHFGNHLDYIASSESTQTIIETTEYGTIIRTPYIPNFANRLMLKYGESKFKLIRRIFTAYYEFAQWLFPVGPKVELYFGAKEYLKNNKVDAIIATGDPFILFKYASMLSKEFDIPWMADYRDPWSQSLAIENNILLKKWNNYFEKKITNTSYLITTVSNFLVNKISTLVKNKEFIILPNGYDPQAIESIKNIRQQNDFMSIAIAGTIYNWHPIRSFLSVVSSFIKNKNHPKLKINFYGINIESELNEMLSADFADLKQYVTIYPKMNNNILIKELAKENIMLLFNYYSYMGTKIYDYIGVKRTILLCYANDEDALKLKKKYYPIVETGAISNNLQENLINETNSGYVIQNAEHLLTVLNQLYDHFLKNGYIECNTINAENYSRKHQVKQLSEIIKNIGTQQNYQICSRCVMDTSDPDISFNTAGECNHCTDFLNNRAKYSYHGKESDNALKHLIQSIKEKGKGNEYDCIIGISGGVDSCYAAYIAKQNGLRVLAVHMDNGWNSEEAVLNIKNVANKLNIDYQSDVLDWEEFKDLQLAFLKASVPEAETPTDMAIISSLHTIAAKYNIKYIISGGNFATEGILPKYWHYNAKDIKYFKYIHDTFGSKKLKKFKLFGYKQEMFYKLVRGKQMVYLLNYVPYSKTQAMEFLTKEFNWRYYGGKHYESVYTGFIQSYYLFKKFNIDYRRATFSSQICTGATTRTNALKELEILPYNEVKSQSEKEYIAKKLTISVDEFEHIIKLPVKWYSDYPNDEKLLNFIYDTYRKLFNKDKLGNF